MTPEERNLILSLVVVPGGQSEDHREEVLRHFNMSDGAELGLRLLRDAMKRQDGLDVEMAMIVASAFGITMDYLEPLVELSSATWHKRHEDIVSLLGQLRTSAAVPALYEATQWIPDYLDFDESRALATKAIWAIGGIPGESAEKALTSLRSSDDEIIQEEAERQLKRR